MKRFPKNAIIRFEWIKSEAFPPNIKLNPFAVLFGLKSAKPRDCWQLLVYVKFPHLPEYCISARRAYRNPIDEPNDRKGILLTLDAAIKELSDSKTLRRRIWRILGEASTTSGTVMIGRYGREIRLHSDNHLTFPLSSDTQVSLGHNIEFSDGA